MEKKPLNFLGTKNVIPKLKYFEFKQDDSYSWKEVLKEFYNDIKETECQYLAL